MPSLFRRNGKDTMGLPEGVTVRANAWGTVELRQEKEGLIQVLTLTPDEAYWIGLELVTQAYEAPKGKRDTKRHG